MRIRSKISIVLGLTVLAGCGGGSGNSGSNATRSYQITDLGAITRSVQKQTSSRDSTPPPPAFIGPPSIINQGGSGTIGVGIIQISPFGQVAGTTGSSAGPANMQAFLYVNGNRVTIGTLGGPVSEALGINASGQVVGAASLPPSAGGNLHAILYSNGKLSDLGTLGGPDSIANAINANGEIVGTSSLKAGSAGSTSQTAPWHAFLYNQGTMADLGTLPGYPNSTAVGINDAGQIIGMAQDNASPPNTVGFVYTNGALHSLGTLGGTLSAPIAINAQGQVVGGSTTAPTSTSPSGEIHPFLWQNGKMTDIGTLGGTHGNAMGINNLGQVVGGSTTVPNGANDHAFLYDGKTMTDLNTQIPGNSGWLLVAAMSINDQGKIVGIGNIGGQVHAFLLTPQ